VSFTALFGHQPGSPFTNLSLALGKINYTVVVIFFFSLLNRQI